MKKYLLAISFCAASIATSFGAAPYINLISGTNVVLHTTNKTGGVDVQINAASADPSKYVFGVGDTNLQFPFRLVVGGDSLANTPGTYNWPYLLTNTYPQLTNMIRAALSGQGIAQSVAAYAGTVHPHAPSVTGENGIYWYHGLNNDAVAGDAQTTILAFSNHLEVAKADGWKIGVVDLAWRGGNTNGHSAEKARVLINDWIRYSPLISYRVEASKMFPYTNSGSFYQDWIHLNSNGSWKIMNAVAESMRKGPGQSSLQQQVFVIDTNSYFGVYGSDGGLPFYISGSNANVGFGTTNVNAAKVNVAGYVRAIAADQAKIYAVGTSATLGISKDEVTVEHILSLDGTDDVLFKSYDTGLIAFREDFRWKNDGSFGIGTSTTTGNKLVVAGKATFGDIQLSTNKWKDGILQYYWASTGPTAPAATAVTNGSTIQGIGFTVAGLGTQTLYGSLQFGHDIVASNNFVGTTYTQPHLHVSPTTAPSAGSSNVNFLIVYDMMNMDGTKYGPITRTKQIGMPNLTFNNILAFPNETNFFPAYSGVFRCSIIRTNATSNEYNATIILDSADVHYPVDKLGTTYDTAP